MLVRRADAGVVIGASLAAKPPGLGTGRSRSRWAGRRARFVGWPIRFAARAEEWRASFTGLERAPVADGPLPVVVKQLVTLRHLLGRPDRGTATDHPRGTRSPKEPGQAPVPV